MGVGGGVASDSSLHSNSKDCYDCVIEKLRPQVLAQVYWVSNVRNTWMLASLTITSKSIRRQFPPAALLR